MSAIENGRFPMVRIKLLLDALESGRREVSDTDTFEDGVLSVGGEHIGWKGEWLLEKPRFVAREFFDAMKTGIIEKDDVLLVKDGATIGKVAIADKYPGQDAAVNEHVFLLRFHSQSHKKFYFYVLQSLVFQEQIQVEITGAAQPGLNTEFRNIVVVPAPPKSTQILAAEYLDRETVYIDALIAEKECMLALLEEKRATLISEAVTRGLDPDVPLKPSGLDWLGDIPAHWDVCQQKRAWKSSDYGISDSIREDGDIKVLRMSCIVNGRVDLDMAGTIEDVDSYLLLRKGDLLFNRTNSMDQIAKVGTLDADSIDPISFASYLVRIRTNHRALPKFLVYLLNSREFLAFARKNAIPAIGQANLSPSKYGELEIPLPPLEEQRAIVIKLDAEEIVSFDLTKELSTSISLLMERRSALITAAVTGQLTLEDMAA